MLLTHIVLSYVLCAGKLYFANGNLYSGGFVEDEFSGKGTFTHKNGDTYVGEFLNNKKSGQGGFTYILLHSACYVHHFLMI
jgi:hypothetical protein